MSPCTSCAPVGPDQKTAPRAKGWVRAPRARRSRRRPACRAGRPGRRARRSGRARRRRRRGPRPRGTRARRRWRSAARRRREPAAPPRPASRPGRRPRPGPRTRRGPRRSPGAPRRAASSRRAPAAKACRRPPASGTSESTGSRSTPPGPRRRGRSRAPPPRPRAPRGGRPVQVAAGEGLPPAAGHVALGAGRHAQRAGRLAELGVAGEDGPEDRLRAGRRRPVDGTGGEARRTPAACGCSSSTGSPSAAGPAGGEVGREHAAAHQLGAGGGRPVGGAAGEGAAASAGHGQLVAGRQPDVPPGRRQRASGPGSRRAPRAPRWRRPVDGAAGEVLGPAARHGVLLGGGGAQRAARAAEVEPVRLDRGQRRWRRRAGGGEPRRAQAQPGGEGAPLVVVDAACRCSRRPRGPAR